jgi:peptidoglycan-N-acetylglucosamine deacetylase
MKVVLDRFYGGKRKALTMSYDDGVRQDIRLISIFNKYGIKGTFNLNSGNMNKESGWNLKGVEISRLSREEVGELYKDHEIAAHSLTHPHLESLSKEELIYEIMEDRKNLEEISGYPVRGFAYPFGTYNQEVINALAGMGIEYARTVETTGGFKIPEKLLALASTCHHNDKLLEKGREFLSLNRGGNLNLMYVWGHSYEFDVDNNWEVIEEFCSEVSNDEDVWYATNMEIVDYLKALKGLKFSADRSIVYNPSALSLWFTADNEVVRIDGGHTLRL